VVGTTALVSSVVYFLSDFVEAVEGGFSVPQLWMTLVGEVLVPLFVVGLCVVQRPRLGWLGRIGAYVYAYSFLFFTGTVIYALATGTPDYATLSRELDPAMTVHGAVFVLAGLAFGYAVLRAGVLPRWTAIALMLGVCLVAATQGMSEASQLAAAGIRDLAFAGMGVAALRVRTVEPTSPGSRS
jgi:predicted Na+-dependent transporter